MPPRSAVEISQNLTATPDIDERRCAPWLLNAYSDSTWSVTDTRNPEKKATIDFDSRLADGRSLTEAKRLYASVKEYAWWVRDARFSRIDDAVTHALMVRNLIHIAHALTIRNIWTFAHLQPYDLEQLIEDCRYGLDAVLHASERIEAYLCKLAATNKINPRPFGGLPQYIIPSSRARTTVVCVEPIIAACNLPPGALKLPRVAALIAQAAQANGLTSRSGTRLAPLTNNTVQAVQRWLDPIEQLHVMRRQIEAEAIGFKPFPRGAARVAAVKGVGVERTPIPPPMLVLHLLEHAARWLTDRRKTEFRSALSREDVRRTATACWIIIAAFTARRDEEVDELQHGCLRGNAASGWWLNVYIEKTLQRKEWIPVPELVAQAVEVLSNISAIARRKTGTDHLFQWQLPNGEVMRLNMGRHLNAFAAAVQVPLHRPRGGPPVTWHWHPHQFRRFFAVLYFYRFEEGTIEALSHHMRHFNLEMTKRYVTQDPEVAALWTDVEWGYMGHVARSIVAGERSVSGAAGERLKKTARRLIDMFRRKLQIASPERVGASLTLIMQRQGIVLTPKPWVTCSCPRTLDAASKAACRRDRVDNAPTAGPNFAQAGPEVCSFCPHAITEGTRQPVVDAEITHLDAATASGPRAGTLFGALEEARVVELRHARDVRYRGAKPLSETNLDEEVHE